MKTDLNSDLSSYYNGDDLDNPNFLYLGSAHAIDFSELVKQYENGENPNPTMYLTSHYHTAVANAFAQKLMEQNPGKENNISINSYSIPIMVAENVKDLDDNDQGFLYIFECPEDAKKFKGFNFIVNGILKPIKVKELYYKDHKIYYRINPVNQIIK